MLTYKYPLPRQILIHEDLKQAFDLVAKFAIDFISNSYMVRPFMLRPLESASIRYPVYNSWKLVLSVVRFLMYQIATLALAYLA